MNSSNDSLPSSTPPARARNPFRSLRDRNFATAWSGMALSNIGTWVQIAIVPFVVYRISGSTSTVGLVTFVQFIPSLLLGPVSGVLAERADRRPVIIATSVLGAVAAFTLCVSWYAGSRSLIVIAACVMIAGAANALGLPAWQALVYDLADPSDLQNAITLNSGQFNLARAVGPALAGVMYVQLGAGSAFLLNGLSFGFACVAMLLTRVPGDPRAATKQARASVLDAFRYMRQRVTLVFPMLLVGIAVAGTYPLLQLVPAYAKNVLDVGPAQFGYMTAMFGLGGVVSTLMLGAIAHRFTRSMQAAVALTAMVLALITLAVVPSFSLAMIAMLVLGMGYLAVATACTTAVQLAVDGAYRGRVLAMYLTFITGMVPFYALVAGFIAQRFGVQGSFTAAACFLASMLAVFVGGARYRRVLDATHV
jgi:predicted MFS family arabinose efflux permease